MSKQFKITQRHYDIIIKQSRDNLPQESGGFLGGKNGLIQAILPNFNMFEGNRTDTFGLTQEDMLRAHEFFQKHNLTFYGVYHTHPNGIPFPSTGDLKTNQKHHFIIGMKNPDKPIFNAFICKGMNYTQIPLKVVDMKGLNIKDIHGDKAPTSLDQMVTEHSQIDSVISNIVNQKENKYEKLDGPNLNSDFSTLA
ncbi:hypothetical protein HOH45_08340 [bacterium]|jgi:proteasome lid subunit RPN8/RPN11|nr:hypothetical protein [bacterium]